MGDRAKRPLNKSAVRAADDDLYQNHADDPRPNALYDADGNRKPLDPDDPDQAGLRQEWMDAYQANGGDTEKSDISGTPTGQVVLPCGQRARVNPVIVGVPVELDESGDEADNEPETGDESEEAEDEGDESTDGSQDDGDDWDAPEPDESADEE
jgi:hypothetical protein